jgi:subtilisin family serine protease
MPGGPEQRSGFVLVALLTAMIAAVCLLVGAPGASALRVSKSQQSYVRAQWPLRAMRVGQARKQAGRLAPVIVATIDTGVDFLHPDLRRRIWHNPSPTPAPLSGQLVPRGAPGWDLISGDARPQDVGGHGTVVAGLIGAQVGNGIGIDGVAPNVRLMALRACTRPGGQDLSCTDRVYAAAIDWAASHGARVIHLSWSLGGGPLVSQAVAAHPETLFVTSAGNGYGVNVDGSHNNCQLPFENVICVAVSKRNRTPAGCTSVGPKTIDVAAPGFQVATTLRSRRYLLDSQCAATFAAPHVTGLAALLLGAVPQADPLAVKQAILQGALAAPVFKGLTATGAIVDALNAVVLLRQRSAFTARDQLLAPAM